MDSHKMRLGLYKKIEIARKQLPDMDEVAFRALMLRECGASSRKDMSIAQLSRIVHLFATMGVTYTAPAKATNKAVKPHSRPDWIEISDTMSYPDEKRQILEIWRKLGYSMNSLDTRVKRAFGVPVFVWMKDGKQISALLSDLQRREKAFERKKAEDKNTELKDVDGLLPDTDAGGTGGEAPHTELKGGDGERC